MFLGDISLKSNRFKNQFKLWCYLVLIFFVLFLSFLNQAAESPVARVKMNRGRRVIRSPLYTSTDSPCRGCHSHNNHGIISTPVDLSTDSQCRGAYYVGGNSEENEPLLAQCGGPSGLQAVDVYTSESELSYPISFEVKPDSSTTTTTTTDVDRHTYGSPSQSHRVCQNSIKSFFLQLLYFFRICNGKTQYLDQ